MRSREEIEEMVKHPARFIKNDLYKVGVIELYPYVPADIIPEIHRKAMAKEVLDNWNPEQEREIFDFPEFVKAEADYLLKLLNNDEVNAAIFRSPRLFALLWLNGESIDRYDKILGKVTHRMAYADAVRLMKKTIKEILKGVA